MGNSQFLLLPVGHNGPTDKAVEKYVNNTAKRVINAPVKLLVTIVID